MLIAFIVFFFFSILMFSAAFMDASIMKIPNWISIALTVLFILIIPFTWTGFNVLGEHLLVGLTFFIAGFVMFALGWMGGGDAKLLAATALWWTWSDAALYIFYVGLIGGALALLLLVGRNYAPARLATSSWFYGLFKEEKQMPYGLALAGGALLTLPQSDILKIAIGL